MNLSSANRYFALQRNNFYLYTFETQATIVKSKLKKGNEMYSIIWRYEVKKKNQVRFETEYGKKGTWAKLFRDSDKYLGSFLHKNKDTTDIYLLIDTWTDERSYEDFKHANREAYDILCYKFEKLYEAEEKIGLFNLVQ